MRLSERELEDMYDQHYRGEPMYTERVLNGVRLLDSEVPGWRDSINVEILDITDPWNCVLGQLFNSYSNGKHVLNISDSDTAWAYGFSGPGLTNHWIHAITRGRVSV